MFLIVLFVTTAVPVKDETPSFRETTDAAIEITPEIVPEDEVIVSPTSPMGDCDPPRVSGLSFLHDAKINSTNKAGIKSLVFINGIRLVRFKINIVKIFILRNNQT